MKTESQIKTRLSTDILQDLVEELCGWDALEVILVPDAKESQKRQTVLIPYVMNDAVESYLELTEAVVQGEWKADQEGEVIFHLEEREDGRKGLFFYQEDNIVSIWFDQAFRHLNGYQYHRIGHMWRKDPGEEHIRQLVHLLCVIHDKWNFIGEEACNEDEKQLYPLAEFAPLRYFTPINESILEWYQNSIEGIKAFEDLVTEAGEEIRQYLQKDLLRYKEAILQEKAAQRQLLHLAKKLSEPECTVLFDLLREKIIRASQRWPERIYTQPEQTKAELLREKAGQSMIQQGYTGTYPCFENETERVFFCEEQPFTVMESEEYCFTIMELHIEKIFRQKSRLLGKTKPKIMIKKWNE